MKKREEGYVREYMKMSYFLDQLVEGKEGTFHSRVLETGSLSFLCWWQGNILLYSEQHTLSIPR